MRKILILLTCVCCWNLASAQLPNTNIYLFQMEQQGDSSFLFKNPQFITGFNSTGYNNQPAFISNDEIYFSMGSTSEESQTDIISLNLKTQVKTQVTKSEDREYSPTILVVSDKRQMEKIRNDFGISQLIDRARGNHFYLSKLTLDIIVG